MTGNRVHLENMGSKFLADKIIQLGENLIDPEISICTNPFGEPK
jgi:hypothetical protein